LIKLHEIIIKMLHPIRGVNNNAIKQQFICKVH